MSMLAYNKCRLSFKTAGLEISTRVYFEDCNGEITFQVGSLIELMRIFFLFLSVLKKKKEQFYSQAIFKEYFKEM